MLSLMVSNLKVKDVAHVAFYHAGAFDGEFLIAYAPFEVLVISRKEIKPRIGFTEIEIAVVGYAKLSSSVSKHVNVVLHNNLIACESVSARQSEGYIAIFALSAKHLYARICTCIVKVVAMHGQLSVWRKVLQI